MSGQGAVGFGFQADIVNTASVGHLLTGRILKAMSDGGVDAYAVAAAVELGKLVPVRTSLESGVRTHLMSRRSFTSVLNMALSIGWGHSELAIEMTRTRAGTNAILLIGALTAGGYPSFHAAQCLSELMSIYGCEADRLPNVDVLKTLVCYLAPFTFDFGFSKVLQHITTVAERAMRSRGYNKRPIPHQLVNLGSAPMLAGAIKQLTLTAERGERMYMILKKHGSWLPAFASHILGMEVEIRYTRTRAHLGRKGKDEKTFHNDTTLDASGHTRSEDGDSQKERDVDNDVDDPVIWACAGDQGSVLFELEDSESGLLPLYRSTGSGIVIVDSDKTHTCLQATHILQDALKNELARYPDIGEELNEGIHKAIVRLSWTLLQAIRMTDHRRYVTPKAGHPINGDFDSLAALKETLGLMGIPESSLCVIGLRFSASSRKDAHTEETRLAYLDPKHLESLRSISRGDGNDKGYLYDSVSELVLDFASTAVALMQCRFDASQLRVKVTGVTRTDWARHCRAIVDGVSNPIDDDADLHISYGELLGYLKCLLSSEVMDDDRQDYWLLGISSSTFTVYYTALMEHEAYDAYGRMISITSGRASYNGSVRNIIWEQGGQAFEGWSGAEACPGPFALAAGSFVEPHCAPSAMTTFIHTRLDERAIIVNCRVGYEVTDTSYITLTGSISALMRYWKVPKCRHDRNTAFRVKEDMGLSLVGFHPEHIISAPGKSELTIVAVHGNKLHQILSCGFCVLSDHKSGRVPEEAGSVLDTKILQLKACLKCCIEQAGTGGPKACIIMGG